MKHSAHFSRRAAMTLTALTLCTGAQGQVVELLSAAPDPLYFGLQGAGGAFGCDQSDSGRYVVFSSDAPNLVAEDSNEVSDVFLRDRTLGTTLLVSQGTAGQPANGRSYAGRVDGTGRFVVFESMASNLVAGDTNAAADVFLFDATTATITRLSENAGGTESGGQAPSISGAGDQVVFSSDKALVGADNNNRSDVYLWTRGAVPSLTQVSLGVGGVQGNQASDRGVISGDGTTVAFQSLASNLVAGDLAGNRDVFLLNLNTGTLLRVLAPAGLEPDADTFVEDLNFDGSQLVLRSAATNLVNPPPATGVSDVYVFNNVSGILLRASVDSLGGAGDGSSQAGRISGAGNRIVFQSKAANLDLADPDAGVDVFLHDRSTAATVLVSDAENSYGLAPCLNQTGDLIAFDADDAAGAPGDQNAVQDVVMLDTLSGDLELVSGADASGPIALLPGNRRSSSPALSSDGRKAAFVTRSRNLLDASSAVNQVVLTDLGSGQMTLVSVDEAGQPGDGTADQPAVNGTGSVVAFQSAANLVASGGSSGGTSIYVADRVSGAITRATLSSGGTPGGGRGSSPDLSDDGNRVVFDYDGDDLVAGDTNGRDDVFFRDRAGGMTRRVSVNTAGEEGNGHSYTPRISADGRYVVFESEATNLDDAADTNSLIDVFRHDLDSGVTERVSIADDGSEANGFSASAAISADGRFVAFRSTASNLVPGDINNRRDAFVRDVEDGRTYRVNIAPDGNVLDAEVLDVTLSADGQIVGFVAGLGSQRQAYRHDRTTGETQLLSQSATGEPGNSLTLGVVTSADGSRMVFDSESSNLVTGDINGSADVFIWSTNGVRDPLPDVLFGDGFE